MNRHVNAIAGRLSLRPPQRQALEILDRLTEIVPPKKDADVAAALETIRREYPGVSDFERDFVSVCFALATGVGKTRLMGAFISYLHLAHGIRNFFVLAPNLTIYDKLIADFTPNTPKYVFQGIAEFATEPPRIVTGDNYESMAAVPGAELFGSVTVNIFNISKINSEVRGGKQPRIKRLAEYIGESYFDYLAGLPDLVLLMDESHRYRGSAGVRAINELKPVLGLELTATPQTESAKGPVRFKNVILDYPLAKAMADGFVKEPAVATRKDFNPAGIPAAELERIKLEDGIRLHEQVKVELETYARSTDARRVKPFLLVIARDTARAAELKALMQSDGFFSGQYAKKVIQVDSSTTSGGESDEVVRSLLQVEDPNEPTEVVIHVNMLKEGWDVTNLYTIVPLRPANARTLIEQSIGRGLRLPYGRRTGVAAVDTLSIVAHDKFQEIVDEAKKPDSPVQFREIVLTPEQLAVHSETVVSQPMVDYSLGVAGDAGRLAGANVHISAPIFETEAERGVAEATRAVIRELSREPETAPTHAALKAPHVQQRIAREVEKRWRPVQTEIDGVTNRPDIAAIVTRTTEQIVNQGISIPRIIVVPRGEVRTGFRPFRLDLSGFRVPAVSEELWLQYLRTQERITVAAGGGGIEEPRLENYVVRALMDFDDISYDHNADLLYDLAGQVVSHLRSYLDEAKVSNVLRYYQREIARLVHAQMQPHFYEEGAGYEVSVPRGFEELKVSAYTHSAADPILDFRVPTAGSSMGRHLFGGFRRCLYPLQKFANNSERVMAVILDREAIKWFRPAPGQFQIRYRSGASQPEYVPDFVAEMAEAIHMIEVKMASQMDAADVLAKKAAAEAWCRHASDYAARHGAKPWKYSLISHDVIAENMTLDALGRPFGSR